MSDDVQLSEPAADLLAAAAAAAPDWLRRVTVDACAAGGVDPSVLGDDLDDVVTDASARLVDELRTLLSTDVDEQRTTPLSICRAAVSRPTQLLQRHGVPTPSSTADGRPATDPYGLAPASWADVDPSLHEPGLRWGAWKALVVLQRRRDEGLR